MNPKVTLLMALAAFAISAGSAQHAPHPGHLAAPGYGNAYAVPAGNIRGPANIERSSKVIDVGGQSASNDYSKSSSNQNRGYNVNSKVDVDESKTAQKEGPAEQEVVYEPIVVQPPPPPPKEKVVVEPVYVAPPPAPKY